MKACNECHIAVQTKGTFCPLCGTQLTDAEQSSGAAPARNEYPDLSGAMVAYSLVLRIMLFASLLGSGVSILINLLVTPGSMWSLIVVAVVVYCWATIPPLLRKGVNFAKQTVLMVSLTSLLVVGLDMLTGYQGWSVTYVVPGLLTSGTVAIALMVLFNRTNWAQYVMYQLLMGIFGFIPLILYFAGASHNLILVLVSSGVSLASLLATFVFADRTIKSEFKRRLHF